MGIKGCGTCSGSMINRNDESGNYLICLMCGRIRYLDIIDPSSGDVRCSNTYTKHGMDEAGRAHSGNQILITN
jgi:hypothetical protein